VEGEKREIDLIDGGFLVYRWFQEKKIIMKHLILAPKML